MWCSWHFCSDSSINHEKYAIYIVRWNLDASLYVVTGLDITYRWQFFSSPQEVIGLASAMSPVRTFLTTLMCLKWCQIPIVQLWLIPVMRWVVNFIQLPPIVKTEGSETLMSTTHSRRDRESNVRRSLSRCENEHHHPDWLCLSMSCYRKRCHSTITHDFWYKNVYWQMKWIS